MLHPEGKAPLPLRGYEEVGQRLLGRNRKEGGGIGEARQGCPSPALPKSEPAKRILITGISGLIGSFLAEYLLGKKANVYGAIHVEGNIENIQHIKEQLILSECDVRNREMVRKVVDEYEPEVIFHLGGQAYPLVSWKDPLTTLETNIMGTANLFEAVREASIEPVIVVACSSAEYGDAASSHVPLREDDPLLPLSPYAVSKVGQDLLSYQYYRNFGLKAVRARIFGTIGPGKTGDACSDFSEQIAKIEAGLQRPVIPVGNLDSERDLTDVRDVVKALWLLSERARFGETYNVCSGKAYRIGQILSMLLSMAKVRISVRRDLAKVRPSDEPLIVGDNSKIKSECGWRPEISVEDSMKNILNYWRERIKKNGPTNEALLR